MRIFADFDGTIALPDVTDMMLQRFAAPEWVAIESDWLAGAIDAATCMRRQIALINASTEQLQSALDEVAIDPDFPEFARWCSAQNISLTVVSDGVDYFIRAILTRHGLGDIPIFANALNSDGLHHQLELPWFEQTCTPQQGVCKCAVTRAASDPIIFVGDGRSDECVSRVADVVFAKRRLADFCIRTGRRFTPFTTFADVHAGVMALTRDVGEQIALANQ